MTRAVVLAVGDELLTGERRDANGTWLAQAFHTRGVELIGVHLVRDQPLLLEHAIRDAIGQADLVVISGGLGPTEDDTTRAALAAAAGVTLEYDAGAWEAIVACMRRRDRVPAGGERRQALVPTGGRWLANDVGVAPGLALTVGSTRIFAFPGVPREWQAMNEAYVLPGLVGRDDVAEAVVWVAGVPESEVAARLLGAEALEGAAVASYPHDGEVELRLRAEGREAGARVRAAEAATRARLGADVFDPPPGGRIEHVVVAGLAARGWRVATAESITGGLIARMLTRVPGASRVYPLGWVTYASEQKTAQLGVPASLIAEHGVVSAQVARAMAEGAQARAGVEAALATTGTAGPDPLLQAGREPVPPGRVHLALACVGRETEVLDLTLPHPREMVQRLAAVRALDRLRRALLPAR